MPASQFLFPNSPELRVHFRFSVVWVCAWSVLAFAGCEQRQHVVPVKGKVLFRDAPLKSGSVMFQPEGGIPASGKIQSDGTFTLSTYDVGDGATVGKNKVRVVSTDLVEQDPNQEAKVGNSVIPEKYNSFGTSPLEFEVKEPGHEDAVLTLED
jgi:hypothetical protein